MQAEGREINGTSLIISPKGEIVTGPSPQEELLFADLDLDDIQRGKFDLDVAGHYNSPDIFQFKLRCS